MRKSAKNQARKQIIFPRWKYFIVLSYLSWLLLLNYIQFSSVQSLSRVRLFATPWTAARQASLSITNSWSSPRLMSIKSVVPSSHRKLSAEELILLNCGVGEDSWESLGLQGDPTSPFWRRSALGFLWKEWC